MRRRTKLRAGRTASSGPECRVLAPAPAFWLLLAVLAVPCAGAPEEVVTLTDVEEPEVKSEEYGIPPIGDDEAGLQESAFDCVQDSAECAGRWSSEKKAWCRENEDVRCEAAKNSPAGIAMAWMLLGSVAFAMALFYLVNWPDKDIRRHSWSIISCTISIFTAVLMFQGINSFIMFFVPEEKEILVLVMHLLQFLTYFIVMNISVAVISGANFEGGHVDIMKEAWLVADTMRTDYGEPVREETVRHPIGAKSIAVIDGLEVFVRRGRPMREKREISMKCWATLLAHMTGFAAINMGGGLQHLPVFASTPLRTAVAMLINQLFLWCLFRIMKEVRKRTEAMDGEVDERDKLYDEYAEEAENDVAGLSISFLTVQAIRFWLTGVLPNHEGDEPPDLKPSWGATLGLYGAGLLIGAIGIIYPIVIHAVSRSKHRHLHRHVDMMQNQGLMTFAWCITWATGWAAVRCQVLDPIGGPNRMGGRIMLALALSALAFLVIFGLDVVEDAAHNSSPGDEKRVVKVIRCIINALGILVGFSWEHSFEGAVAAVASRTPHPVTVKLLLAVMLSLVMVPAWLKHVLEKVMIYKRMFADELDSRQIVGRWRVGSGAYEQLEFEDLT